jgi:hypothetical protein
MLPHSAGPGLIQACDLGHVHEAEFSTCKLNTAAVEDSAGSSYLSVVDYTVSPRVYHIPDQF